MGRPRHISSYSNYHQHLHGHSHIPRVRILLGTLSNDNGCAPHPSRAIVLPGATNLSYAVRLPRLRLRGPTSDARVAIR